MKIFLLQRIIPHYRVNVFSRLISKFNSMFIYFGKPYKKEILKNGNIPNNINFIERNNIYFFNEKVFISNIYSNIIKDKPDIIITVFNMGNLNIFFIFLLKYIFKFKIILWSLGYDHETGFHPNNKIKDYIRLKYYQKSDAVIFYWEKGKQEIEKYSKRTEHYFVAPNTIDTDELIKYKKEFDEIGKSKLKKHLIITSNFHFVFVGRLIPDKEVIMLLKAIKQISTKKFNFQVTIIGEGTEYCNLKKYVVDNNLNNVNFTGEILDQSEVAKWIYVSDAFILPGRLGNSVVQSFCFGVPIISQRKQEHFHCEGIAYIKDKINSILFNEGDINDLKNKIEYIMLNPDYATLLGSKAYNYVLENATTEKFIDGFAEAINYVSHTAYTTDK